MKKLLLYSSIALMGFLASCSDEDDSTPSGPTDDRDKFTGAWLCTEKITGQPQSTFTIEFSKTGNDSVKIKNFSNYGDFTYAYGEIAGNGLTIPQQNMGVTSIPIQGYGIYSSSGGGKITMYYNVDGDSASANCVRP